MNANIRPVGRHKFFMKKIMTSDFIKGQIRLTFYLKIYNFLEIFFLQNLISYKSTFMPNHSSTFVYEPILMNICMNDNIMKTHFHEIIYDLKGHFYVIRSFVIFFTLQPSDLITTLSYILMDNFCPCFSYF